MSSPTAVAPADRVSNKPRMPADRHNLRIRPSQFRREHVSLFRDVESIPAIAAELPEPGCGLRLKFRAALADRGAAACIAPPVTVEHLPPRRLPTGLGDFAANYG